MYSGAVNEAIPMAIPTMRRPIESHSMVGANAVPIAPRIKSPATCSSVFGAPIDPSAARQSAHRYCPQKHSAYYDFFLKGRETEIFLNEENGPGNDTSIVTEQKPRQARRSPQ